MKKKTIFLSTIAGTTIVIGTAITVVVRKRKKMQKLVLKDLESGNTYRINRRRSLELEKDDNNNTLDSVKNFLSRDIIGKKLMKHKKEGDFENGASVKITMNDDRDFPILEDSFLADVLDRIENTIFKEEGTKHYVQFIPTNINTNDNIVELTFECRELDKFSQAVE